jgi:methylmalonyl-CoA epimerase
MKIDHIGIAVESLDQALAPYRDCLGLEAGDVDEVEDQGVRVAMLPVGETRIELLEPTRDDSPVRKFLTRRGPGIHHIAVEVDNIEETLDRFRAAGARLINDTPQTGAGGSRIAFIHPSSVGGVLLELVQHGR